MLASGAAIGQLVLLLVSPIVSRLYAPADFGVFGVYLAVVGFVVVVASLRLELAIPLQRTEEDARDLVQVCCAIVFGVSAILLILLALFGNPVGQVLDLPESTILLLLFPLGVIALGIFNVASFWAISLAKYKELAISKGAYGVWASIVQVAAFPLGYFGLVSSDLVGRGLSNAHLFMRTGGKVSFTSIVSRSRARTLIRRNKRFPLIAAPAAAANSAGVYAPTLAIASIFGASTAGGYIFATRVIAAPSGLISAAVSRVYIGELSTSIKGESGEHWSVLVRTALGLALLGVLPFALLYVFAAEIFEFAFGAQWRQAGEIASAISPMLFMQFVAVPISQTLNLLGHQHTQATWDVLRLLGVVAVFIYSDHRGLGILPCIQLLAITATIFYALLILLSLIAARRPRGDVANLGQ